MTALLAYLLDPLPTRVLIACLLGIIVIGVVLPLADPVDEPDVPLAPLDVDAEFARIARMSPDVQAVGDTITEAHR